MNETCDRCGPAVRAVYRATRNGELYLCAHCAIQLSTALSAQGWTIWRASDYVLTPTRLTGTDLKVAIDACVTFRFSREEPSMPLTFVPVATVTSRTEAELIAGLLRNYDVRAVVSADDAGGQEPALQNQGVRVLVAASDEAAARQVLAAAWDTPPGQAAWGKPPGHLEQQARVPARVSTGAAGTPEAQS